VFLNPKILRLKRTPPAASNATSFEFLGNRYFITDSFGKPVSPENASTSQAMLILTAGDKLQAGFLDHCLYALSADNHLAYISTCRRIRHGRKNWLVTHPGAAMSELLPFEAISNRTRCVFPDPENWHFMTCSIRGPNSSGIDFIWGLEGPNTFGMDIFWTLPATRTWANQ